MYKKKIIWIMLLSLLALFCIGCVEESDLNANNTNNTDLVEEYDIARANNAFAFDMYSMIKSNDENVLFSPYSIFTAMAICYDGAEGSTKEQISNVFYYPLSKPILESSSKEMIDLINSDKDAYELKSANALWVHEEYPVNEQYVSNAENYYDGIIRSLDFIGQPEKSTDTINAWVEEKTNDKIKDLLTEGSIGENTKLVITNAIYFNGTWLQEFEEGATHKRTFHLSNGQEKEADMMYAIGTYNYGEDKNAEILELPYKGDDISMYVILPHKNNIDEFERDLTLDYYNELKATLNSNEVKILLPKFTFETKAQLNEPLQDMGITDAFNLGTADFSGISESEDLFISSVIHQAYIGVNEKGTEAAAATAIAVDTGLPYYEYEFTANHPFMFFIEDKRTDCILFMGKVESPENE